ncbi:unnamed protein product [Absidia cylindrospora]
MTSPGIPPLSTSSSPLPEPNYVSHSNKRIMPPSPPTTQSQQPSPSSTSVSTPMSASSIKSTDSTTTQNRRSSSSTSSSSSSSSSWKSSTNGRTATSSWASAKEIISKRGFLALYNGFGLHFLRDSVGTGVYFGGYETTKYLLTKKDTKSGPLTQFLAGGICGILCWLVVFPIDLVKTLKQKEVLSPTPHYRNARECIANIIRQKGYWGFYSGVSVTLLRAFPIHSLNFLVYEQTLLLVGRISHHDGDSHHVAL